jgi:hypothetical protein
MEGNGEDFARKVEDAEREHDGHGDTATERRQGT